MIGGGIAFTMGDIGGVGHGRGGGDMILMTVVAYIHRRRRTSRRRFLAAQIPVSQEL